MCLPSGGGATPTAQAAAPAPTRADATAATDPVNLVNQAKNTLSKRMGVFGNIKTTPLGDAAYGAFARFGR
jgi:hypothetical protein